MLVTYSWRKRLLIPVRLVLYSVTILCMALIYPLVLIEALFCNKRASLVIGMLHKPLFSIGDWAIDYAESLGSNPDFTDGV